MAPLNDDLEQSVLEAASVVRRHWPHRPEAAIVLGTGLNELAGSVCADLTLSYAELPGFSPTTAPGHVGQLICGRLAEAAVLIFQGRRHLYEGCCADEVARPALLAARLGAPVILLTCASGGLAPELQVGQVVLIADHINLQWRLPMTSLTVSGLIRRSDPLPWIRWRARRTLSPYDPQLAETAQIVAQSHGYQLRPVVYAAMLGPNYETKAEYRLLRFLGADVVGMSTVPEALVAAAHEVRVLALSVVTNVYRSGKSRKVQSDEVARAAGQAEPVVAKIVQGVLQRLRQPDWPLLARRQGNSQTK